MEADWSVELTADDPVIVVPWAAAGDDPRTCRFVDLRLDAHLIDEIEEARPASELRAALLSLNDARSPLWTVKCDTWESDTPMDPYEMDAAPEDATLSAASYIDLLVRDSALQVSFNRQERWVRAVAHALRAVPARAARVELVLRPAQVDGVAGYGVSWFVEGCGATAQRAGQAWSHALGAALPVIMDPHLMYFDQGADNDTMSESGE
jgi:hypothetical protein